MQLLPSASPLGAPAASDTSTSDTRPATDPATAGAFQAALSAARQGNGSSATERPAGRPSAPSRQDDDATATDADAEPLADATDSGNEMAALLMWLVPMQAPQTPAAPAVIPTTGDAPSGEASAPVAAASAATSAVPASQIGQPGSQIGSPLGTAVPDDLSTLAAAAASGPPAVEAAPENAPGPSTPTLAMPATTSATVAAQTAATVGTTVASTAQTPGRRTQVTGAETTTTTATATPDATPIAVDATIVASEPTAADGTIPTSASTIAAGAPQTTPATTWASLAADFGARIVTATTTTVTRPAGQAGPRIGQAGIPADAQVPGDGSTAQAAGTVVSTGIQLPGQAVAAAGSPADATPGSFAEALAAGPTTPTTITRRTQAGGASTDLNAAAIGVTSTVGQAQAAGPVETSATAAPPVASQIADLAQVASRRLGQSVQMVLQPEGLGSVTLRVTVERGGLAVHLAVDNAQTREMVQASWPQLQQALDQRGLTVQSMLLDLSQGRSNGEAFQAFQRAPDQQFRGQQSRGSSSSADRRGAITTVDEVARPQSGAGSSSRVDYRI